MTLARALTNELEEAIRLYRTPIMVALGLSLRRNSVDDRFMLTDSQQEDLARNIVRLSRISRIERQMTKGGVGMDERQFLDMSGLMMFNGTPNADETQTVPVPSLGIVGGRYDSEDQYLFGTGSEEDIERKAIRYHTKRPSEVQWRVRSPIMMARNTAIIDFLAFRCNKLPFLHSIAIKWGDKRWDLGPSPITADMFRPEGEQTHQIVLPPVWMDDDMTALDPNIWGQYEDIVRANYEEYLGRRVDEYREDVLAFLLCYEQYRQLLNTKFACDDSGEINERQVGQLERRLTTTLNRTLHITGGYNIDTRDNTYRIKSWSPDESTDATDDVFNMEDADGDMKWTSSFEADTLEDDGVYVSDNGIVAVSADIPEGLPPYYKTREGEDLYGTKSLQIDRGYVARRMVLPDGRFMVEFWAKNLEGVGRIEIIRNTRMIQKQATMDYGVSRITKMEHFRESYETIAVSTIEGMGEWTRVWISFELVDHFFVRNESYPANEIFVVFSSVEEQVGADSYEHGSFRVDHLRLHFNEQGHNVEVFNAATRTPFSDFLADQEKTVNIEEILPGNDTVYQDIERAAQFLKLDGANLGIVAEHRNSFNLHRDGSAINAWFKINSEDEETNDVLQRRGIFTMFNKAGSFVPSYDCTVNSNKELLFTWYSEPKDNEALGRSPLPGDTGTWTHSSSSYRNSMLLPQAGYESLDPYFSWAQPKADLYRNMLDSWSATGMQPREWMDLPPISETGDDVILELTPSIFNPPPPEPPPLDPSGVHYEYYDGIGGGSIPNFDNLIPSKIGIVSTLQDLSPATSGSNYGFRYRSFIQIDIPGLYTFGLNSDDHSKITVDGVVVRHKTNANNTTETGTKFLAPGRHEIVVEFKQGGGGARLLVYWEPPTGGGLVPIPSSILYQEDKVPSGKASGNDGISVQQPQLEQSPIGEGRFVKIQPDDPYLTEGGFLPESEPSPPPGFDTTRAMNDVAYLTGGTFITVDGQVATYGPEEVVTAWKYLEFHARRAYAEVVLPEELVMAANASQYLQNTAQGFVYAPVPINIRYQSLPQDYGFYSPSPGAWSPGYWSPSSPCPDGTSSPCNPVLREWPVPACNWGTSPSPMRQGFSPWPTRWTPVGLVQASATDFHTIVALKLGANDQWIGQDNIDTDYLADFGGEAEQDPLEGDTYQDVPSASTGSGDLTWQVAAGDATTFRFEPDLPSPSPSQLTNYYFLYVFVNDPQNVTLLVEHNAGMKIWWDGQQVYQDATTTSPFDGHANLGMASRGWHKVLVKVTGPDGWWKMRLVRDINAPISPVSEGVGYWPDSSLIGLGSPVIDMTYGAPPFWKGGDWDAFGIDATIQNRAYPMFVQGQMEFDRWFNLHVNASEENVEIGIAGLIVDRVTDPDGLPFTLNDLGERENNRDLWIGTQNPDATNTGSPISLFSFKVYQRRVPRIEVNAIQQQEGMNFNEFQYSIFGEYLDSDNDKVLDFFQSDFTDLGLGVVVPDTLLEGDYGPIPSDPSKLYGRSAPITESPIVLTPNGDRIFSVIHDPLDDAYLEELVRANAEGLEDAIVYWDFYQEEQEAVHAFDNRKWNPDRLCYEDETLPYRPWLFGHIEDEWQSIRSIHDTIPFLSDLVDPLPVSPQTAPEHPTYGDHEGENLVSGVKGWFNFDDIMGYRDSIEKVQKEGIIFNYLQVEFRFRADRGELDAYLADFAQDYDDLFFNRFDGNRLDRIVEE